MTKVPAYLQQGDKICIISTARKVANEDVYPAVEVFKSWGLEVVLAPNLFEVDNQFAGSDASRASDLVWAFENPEFKAIICARGGYGTARLLEKFDHTVLKSNPKWLVGFSDVTVLLSLLLNYNIASIHGVMPLLFKEENSAASLVSLRNALFGVSNHINIAPNPLNRIGNGSGMLIGGNLTMLNNSIATIADIDTQGKILFIEDLDEYLYHIDRMMQHLKLAGKLRQLAGLVVGHFSEMKDNAVPFGKTAYQIIAEAVAQYHYPVCFGFPTGHRFDNLAMKVGIEARLEVGPDQVYLVQ